MEVKTIIILQSTDSQIHGFFFFFFNTTFKWSNFSSIRNKSILLCFCAKRHILKEVTITIIYTVFPIFKNTQSKDSMPLQIRVTVVTFMDCPRLLFN